MFAPRAGRPQGPGGVAGAALLGATLVGCTLTSAGLESDGNNADAARGGTVTSHEGTGTSDDEGGCANEVSNQAAPPQHVKPGTEMGYDGVPPVSGKHWAQWPDITKALYVAEERPDLGQVVHAQEHGWTIVWHDESLAADDAAMDTLRVADDVDGLNLTKVVFMPWTAADGDRFPDPMHLAFTHWGDEDDGTEWRQFCATPSAAAVAAFSERHPSSESREPDAP